MAQPARPSPMILSLHQEAMVEVCKTGQLGELQKLFNEHGVKQGDDPVLYRTATQRGAPETRTLFAAAISHGQQSIVQYLHSIYPKFDFADSLVIRALADSPNLEMLKLIYAYSAGFVHYLFGDNTTTLLWMFCEGGPQNAPLIDFLLDHGAMDYQEYSYACRFGAELLPATQHNQPIETIKKIIPKTRHLWQPIVSAMYRKQADYLRLLLPEEEKRRKRSQDGKYEQLLLTEAQKIGDEQIIAMAERFLDSLAEQAKKPATSAEGLQSTTRTEGRRWWQLGARTSSNEKADAEDSSSAPRTEAGNWWRPFSKGAHEPKSADDSNPEKEIYDSDSDTTRQD